MNWNPARRRLSSEYSRHSYKDFRDDFVVSGRYERIPHATAESSKRFQRPLSSATSLSLAQTTPPRGQCFNGGRSVRTKSSPQADCKFEKPSSIGKVTSLRGDTEALSQLDRNTITNEQIKSNSSYEPNRNPTPSLGREKNIDTSSGASTESTSTDSDMSDDTASLSPESEAWFTVASAKHMMMVSLMVDVYDYAIFNPHWEIDVRSHTGARAPGTRTHAQNSSSRTPASTGRGKRQSQDQDSPSPYGNDVKKRKIKSSQSEDDGQGRLFACCFHKYDAQKYCCNGDTGSKYRSCGGPGFSKISKLKQHLKRIHRAPTHCPRCWLVVESQAEMSVHVNAEERCEQREPQIIDGVDEDKMRLITNTWGASWEDIYEILFPGAPIPSPYYEAQTPAPDTFESSSPGSRELRDFELYSRTTLPLLVEANLRAIVEAHVAPIEERVRAMVVDIVRTCQSTVARNFQLTIAPTLSIHDRTPSSFQTSFSNENTAHKHEEPVHGSAYGSAGDSLNFFQEPSPINAEASASLPTPMYDNDNSINRQTQSQDSGYGTLTEPCSCICHYPSTWDTTMGQSNCAVCGCSLIISTLMTSTLKLTSMAGCNEEVASQRPSFPRGYH
ncbi:hypothetical protein BDR22DRAFT_374189 [Usnea florida]